MNIFIKYLLISSFLISISSIGAAPKTPTPEQIRELETLRITEGLDEEEEFEEPMTSTLKEDDLEYEECKDCIYGFELFRSTPTTFALSSDIPVPPDYTLGPGDKIKIEYYGNENISEDIFIGRSGILNLPLLGPVTLAGLTFSQASDLVSKKVKSELLGTEIYITLSELRSINIYLVGSAYKPGAYTVSALSTITNALFAGGGPNEIGSLRNIQVKRKGKLIKEFDLYDLLLYGDTSSDVRLQQGDAIFIPMQEMSASIEGSVQRPGRYEIKTGEKILDLMKFAGYKNKNGRIELSRIDIDSSKRNFLLFSSNDEDNLNDELQDSDTVNVVNSSNLESRNAFISGEVLYPGYYGVEEGDTLLSLINKAGGLKDSAYTPGAVFTRLDVADNQKESFMKTADSLEKSLVDAISTGVTIEGDAYLAIQRFIETLKLQEPIGRQVIEADTFLLRSDPRLNLSLHDGDTLYLPKRSSSLTVVGEVLNSATHIYKENLNIDDYILLSGGYTDGADPSKIFVILPNGQSLQYKQSYFGRDTSDSLLPGSTIVVSRNPDPFDWLKLTTLITPILSDLAVSAASLAAINN